MITIVEIPHRSPPVVWTARDYNDAIVRATPRNGFAAEVDNSADAPEVLDRLLSDNHVAFVLENAEDFKRFFQVRTGHQSIMARAALRSVIRRQIGRGGLKVSS